jgi:hypothetical protein
MRNEALTLPVFKSRAPVPNRRFFRENEYIRTNLDSMELLRYFEAASWQHWHFDVLSVAVLFLARAGPVRGDVLHYAIGAPNVGDLHSTSRLEAPTPHHFNLNMQNPRCKSCF